MIWIFIFKRELLIRDDSFRLILVVSFILFATGIVLHFTDAGRGSFCGALLSPLGSLGLFRSFVISSLDGLIGRQGIPT